MDHADNGLAFNGGDELRQAAENAFGRSLEPDEWERIDPDGWSANPHAAFSKTDLNDLLQAMAELPPPPHLTHHERQRKRALAHQQRVAAEASTFVEQLRRQVFGAPDPPFKDDILAAAMWIEAHVVPATTTLFTLKIVIPASLDHYGQLVWLRDWLMKALPRQQLTSSDDRHAWWVALLRADASPIRQVSPASPTLAYLGLNPSGDFGIKRVRSDPNTVLGNLWEAADRLSKATGWPQVAAVHHLLTGGVMSSPTSAMTHLRFGREAFGGHAISIEIPDPEGVSAQEIAEAFFGARRTIDQPRRRTHRRARSSAKLEHLAALMEETPQARWMQRWMLWNERYPDDRFPNPEAMRQAYRRAQRP